MRNNVVNKMQRKKMVLIVLYVFVISYLLAILGFASKSDGARPGLITRFTPTQESSSLLISTETPSEEVPAPVMTMIVTEMPSIFIASIPSATPFMEGPIVFGKSFGGHDLNAYRFGSGPVVRALVGGIHGGYEWNTTTLINEFSTYLSQNQSILPPQLTLYLIPLANPDGAAAGTDRINGRMNGNGVDLNRNWDYQWQPTATHGPWEVSAGSSPFSEPETSSLRDFLLLKKVQAVIFYHSAMAEIYSGAGIDTSKTVELAQLLAMHTGYRYAPEGIPGQITTGNAADWLTVNGITAVEVDLRTHEDIDWEVNLEALRAFLNWDLPEE